jgi:hypothetical protein
MKDNIQTNSPLTWLEDMLIELASLVVLGTFLTTVALWASIMTQRV